MAPAQLNSLDTLDDHIEAHIDLASEDVASEPNYAAEALLVRALVHEVQTGALLTAGATSAINMAGTRSGARALSEARTLVRDFPAQLDQWPKAILGVELARATIEDVAAFYATFRNARARLHAFESDARNIGLDRAGTLHLPALTTAWRLAARHAGYAVTSISLDAERDLPASFADNAKTLNSVLERATAGEPVCCQRDGTIVLPQLAERRRAPRRSLLQTARVTSGAATFNAFARDISAGGIGLTRMPPMTPGSPITVELSCGRSFHCKVAWSEGIDTGVQFERPLLPTDPLIFG